MANPRDKRKAKREYHLKPTTIRLKERPMRVNDISNEGIGLALEADGPRFFIGERVEKIPLPLENGPVYLKGIVSHISVNSSGTVCGIRFQLSGDEFQTVVRFKKERGISD